MKGKKIIVGIIAVFIILVIVVAVFSLTKVKKNESQFDVANNFALALQDENQLEKFIDENFDLKAVATINKMFADESGFPEDRQEAEQKFLNEYNLVSDEQINTAREEKITMLKELVMNKEYTLKDKKERDVLEFNYIPTCFKVYEASYKSDDDSKIIITYATYEDKIVSIISVYTNEQ